MSFTPSHTDDFKCGNVRLLQLRPTQPCSLEVEQRPSLTHNHSARKTHQPFPSQPTSSRLTSLPTIILPIHPTALVLGNILIPILPRQIRRRRAPHARLAIKHQLLLHRRLAEAKAILELSFVQEHGVGLRFDRDVDRAGDETGLVLGGLADV
jgi:hypothetical protein